MRSVRDVESESDDASRATEGRKDDEQPVLSTQDAFHIIPFLHDDEKAIKISDEFVHVATEDKCSHSTYRNIQEKGGGHEVRGTATPHPSLSHRQDGKTKRCNKGDHGLSGKVHGKRSDEKPKAGCCSHSHGHTQQSLGRKHAHGRINSVEVDIVDVDIESNRDSESVTLLVEGMDCSSCGVTLHRALEGTPGVSRVQVNFVMGKADFQLDTTIKSIDDTIRTAERATGFRCTLSGGDNQYLDLHMPKSSAATLAETDIPGLVGVSYLKKNTTRLFYDPGVIGARTLVNRVGDLSKGMAHPADDRVAALGWRELYANLMKTILAAILTIPVVTLVWGPPVLDARTKAIVCFVLATLVQFVAIKEFYTPAVFSLFRNRTVEMDMLVVISITAAYVYSIVAFGYRMASKPLEISEIFETSTLLITFVLLGRLIASYARTRAIQAVSLRSLQPTTAVVIEDGGEMNIDSRLLQLGDHFKLQPDSQVPTDGLVLQGQSEVDESMLTGESLPVPKRPGDSVIAGTVNESGTMVVKLTRLPGKNTVTDIAGLVEEASKSKPKIQDIADRVAGYFVPLVSAAAVIVFIAWALISLKVRHESAKKSIADAIGYTVAVLAVSCPCALGLAVPMVLVVAAGMAARGGVVIKSADATVRSRKVTDVVFDKTGTITEASLDIVDYEVFIPNAKEALSITKALVQDSKHPVAAAVNKTLESQNINAAVTTGNCSIPGEGVMAIHRDVMVKAGNPAWTLTSHHPEVFQKVGEGFTLLTVTRGDALLVLFLLKTRLQSDAKSVIQDLQRRNISIHMVSGDQRSAVHAVASEVGIPHENVAAQRTPVHKQTYVSFLKSQGKTVMFCGDGTNDAAAVAQADIGVQVGGSLSSSDVTRGAADVILLSGLGGILHLLDTSESAFRRIIFNFVWAGVYNVLAILLAAGAFVRFRIPPAYAGLGELVSVLPVVLVAMTMLFVRPSRRGS